MKSFSEVLIEQLEGKQLDNAYDLFNRANAYAELGRHDEAIADYDRVNELMPNYETGMAWYNRGNSLSALGRDDEAVESHERAIAAGTREWPPFVNALLIRMRQKRYDDAIRYCDRYLALAVPGDELGCANADAMIRKAELLHIKGDTEAATALVSEALSVDDGVHALAAAADFYALCRGAWADALPLLERVCARDAHPVPGMKLGVALANLGREQEALDQLRPLIEKDPTIADSLRNEGWSALLKDRTFLDRL